MNNERFGVLVVDDEFSVRDSLYQWFRKDGYRVGAAEHAAAALAELERAPWDVVLLDIRLPGMDGMELLHRLRELAPDSMVIMMTAHGTIETAVEALKCGAVDYLTKPIDPDELSRVVAKAIEQRRRSEEAERGRPKATSAPPDADEIVCQSPQMRRVMELVESLAGTDVTVLIRGESGTGKELLARAIHARSARRSAPLVALSFGALPESLLESELFGHEPGAFAGAQHRHRGKLEQADGGTLFLDEIGTTSLRTQIDLLRVLETKELTRVGGDEPVRVDFRVVCATNQDLEELVRKRELREDLYFCVNVFRIDLPPLRERAGDVVLLARHFLRRFAVKLDKALTDLAPDAIAALTRHRWPGNVRELKSAIERAVILAEPPLLHAKDLVAGGAHLGGAANLEVAPAGSLADSEKAHVAKVLDQCGWNISRAARVLEVDRVTLYNKIKKYGLRGE